MKQTNLLKTFLLLCALVVGSTCAWADTKELTFDLSSNPGDWPTTNSSTEASYTYTLDEVDYTFKLKNVKCNNGYLMIYYVGSVGLPAIEGYQLTKVVVSNSSSCSNTTKVGISSSSSSALYVDGGEIQTWSTKGSTYTYDLTGTEDNTVYYLYVTNKNAQVTQLKLTYESAGSVTPTCATPTFNPGAGTYTSAQNVAISSTTEGATIYYTTDGTDPTTSSSVYSSAINVSTNTTIKAIAVKEGNNNSAVASATYQIVNIEHAGTEADPYTVADARNAIDLSTGITGVYATGIVSEIVTDWSSTHNNISFNISTDGKTTSDQLQAYRCVSTTDADASTVQVGDVVVIYGNLKKYNSTYEFDQNCQLISKVNTAATVVLDKKEIAAPAAGADGTINVTYNNITTVVAEVILCDKDGNDATYDWIVADLNASNNVEYIIDPNTGASRTAYLKVKALDDNADDVFSSIVTITQAAVPYATLPFAFDGGKNDIESTIGLTQNGLGSDYGSSPKLKFDGTDDYLILQINEVPGSLSFDIKGNSFSDGTFTVQTSADGENYTDLKAYTELGATATESFALASTVRYIKWIYTEKVNGNVALGNISLVTDGVVPVIISAAGLATFASDEKLDFTNVENLEAYIAKEVSGAIKLTKVNKVPANTGVLLRALNDATDFNVPVTTATADAVTGNLFVRGAGAAVASEDGGKYNYVLGKHEGKVGFYKAGGMVVATNKAYLQTTVAAARIDVDFDETTSLTLVNSEKSTVNNEYYNLAGQRVANPTKGLYIVNGKKVVMK